MQRRTKFYVLFAPQNVLRRFPKTNPRHTQRSRLTLIPASVPIGEYQWLKIPSSVLSVISCEMDREKPF